MRWILRRLSLRKGRMCGSVPLLREEKPVSARTLRAMIHERKAHGYSPEYHKPEQPTKNERPHCGVSARPRYGFCSRAEGETLSNV